MKRNRADVAILLLLLATASMTEIELSDRVTTYDVLVFAAAARVLVFARPLVTPALRIPFLTGASGFGLVALDLALSELDFTAIVNGGAVILGLLVFFVISRIPRSAVSSTHVLLVLLFMSVAHWIVGQTEPGRPSGLTRFPNELAHLGNGMLLIALFGARDANRIVRWTAVGAGLMMIILPQSRASLLLAGAQLALFVLTDSNRRDRVWVVLALVGSFAFLLSRGLSDVRVVQRLDTGVTSLDDPNFFYFENWTAGLELFATSPLVGVGSGNAFLSSSNLNGNFIVHSSLVGILASTGLVGAFLFGAVLRKTWLRVGVLPNVQDRFALALLVIFKLSFGSAANSRPLWICIAVFLYLSSQKVHTLAPQAANVGESQTHTSELLAERRSP